MKYILFGLLLSGCAVGNQEPYCFPMTGKYKMEFEYISGNCGKNIQPSEINIDGSKGEEFSNYLFPECKNNSKSYFNQCIINLDYDCSTKFSDFLYIRQSQKGSAFISENGEILGARIQTEIRTGYQADHCVSNYNLKFVKEQ